MKIKIIKLNKVKMNIIFASTILVITKIIYLITFVITPIAIKLM